MIYRENSSLFKTFLEDIYKSYVQKKLQKIYKKLDVDLHLIHINFIFSE